MVKIAIFDSGVETPEEIFMAAGFTPFRLLGDPTIEHDKVNEHVPPTHCVWARNILEQALRGLDPEIEGIISSHGCDCSNREFDIWVETVDIDFLFYLNVPLKRDKIALNFFLNDLKELISQIEDRFKIKIQTEKIKESIKLTNHIRRLLKEISEYRSRMILKGSEFHNLIKMSQTDDKNNVIDNLYALLPDVFRNGVKLIDDLVTEMGEEREKLLRLKNGLYAIYEVKKTEEGKIKMEYDEYDPMDDVQERYVSGLMDDPLAEIY